MCLQNFQGLQRLHISQTWIKCQAKPFCGGCCHGKGLSSRAASVEGYHHGDGSCKHFIVEFWAFGYIRVHSDVFRCVEVNSSFMFRRLWKFRFVLEASKAVENFGGVLKCFCMWLRQSVQHGGWRIQGCARQRSSGWQRSLDNKGCVLYKQWWFTVSHDFRVKSRLLWN